jgi:hypothetical protein
MSITRNSGRSSAESGTLAASMKLRLRVVEERYRQRIEELCAQAGRLVLCPSPVKAGFLFSDRYKMCDVGV